MASASATCLRLGASTAEAADCSTEMPIRRMNPGLSWRMTSCTVRPFRLAILSCKINSRQKLKDVEQRDCSRKLHCCVANIKLCKTSAEQQI